MTALEFYEMKDPARFPEVVVWSKAQEATLGRILSRAVSAQRAFEIRNDGHDILVLLSPADDLGQVWAIPRAGTATQIGVTERQP